MELAAIRLETFRSGFAILDARSKTPIAGLVANPTTPLPIPLKNPRAPSRSAPSSGFRASPPTPLAKLVINESAPWVTPYNACFGRFREREIRLRSWNCLSSVAAERPILRQLYYYKFVTEGIWITF